MEQTCKIPLDTASKLVGLFSFENEFTNRLTVGEVKAIRNLLSTIEFPMPEESKKEGEE